MYPFSGPSSSYQQAPGDYPYTPSVFNYVRPFQYIECILTHKIGEDGKRLFLVKLIDRSYRNLEWLPITEFKTLSDQKMVKNYNKLHPDKPPEPPFFDVDYTIPDRIIAESKGKYLVKWKSLDYESATWENVDDITDNEVIDSFYKRIKLPNKEELSTDYNRDFEKIESVAPSKSGFSLRDYQIDGLNFIMKCWCSRRNCILADEMGLGKTCQVVTFLGELNKRKKVRGPFLIVVPLSTIGHWEKELDEWMSLRYLVFYYSKTTRELMKRYEFFFPGTKITQFNVCVTTYEYISKEIEFLSDIEWEAIIVDEAHRLKNNQSKLKEKMMTLKAKFKLLLTGTPIQNNTNELWSLLNFLDPDHFDSIEEFTDKFGLIQDESQLSQLSLLLKPIMLRRKKSEVEKSIAPIEEIVIECNMTDIQKYYYKSIYTKNVDFLQRGQKKNSQSLMNISMELRKVCNHPYLINGAEESIIHDMEKGIPQDSNELLIRSCGKMILLDKLLVKLCKEKHKILIFSQMSKMLDIIQDYLFFKNIKSVRIDGSVRSEDRQKFINMFEDPKFNIPIFLLTTKAGGQGINLTAADTVIIYDSDWNPQNDIQATARCHRIGQTKTVKLYRFLTANSYERSMFDRASVKLGLDHAVLEGSRTEKAENLDKLLRLGAYYAFYADDKKEDKFTSEDIEDIITHSMRIKHESVFGGDGSTFSKAQFDVNDAELSAPSFWKKMLYDVVDDSSGEINEYNSHDQWDRKKFKKLNELFLDFGWGRWKKLLEGFPNEADMGLISISEIKSICHVIIKWLLETANDTTKVVETIYESNKADEFEESFIKKYENEFRMIATKAASKRIERIEVLHFLNCATRTCPNAPEGLVLPTTSGNLPTETWTSNDDRKLLYEMWLHGISSYSYPDVTNKALYRRLVTIIKGLKQLFMHYCLTIGDQVAFKHQTLLEASKLWTIEEHTNVVNTLIDFGFPDIDSFIAKCNLNKEKECVNQYVECIFRAARDDSSEQAILKQEISWRDLQIIKERQRFFIGLRRYATRIKPGSKSDDDILILKIAKDGISAHAKRDQIVALVRRLNNHINTAINEECEGSMAVFPVKISPSLYLMSLGKVIIDRPAFHNEKYLFPDGYVSERKYTSAINPRDKVWYRSEIIDNGGSSPLFRVSIRDSPNYRWEGKTASKVWSEVLKTIIESKKRIKDTSKTGTAISGPEQYGLSSPTVLKLFQKMPGAEIIQDFRKPNSDLGITPSTSKADLADENEDFVVNFKKLFERARSLK